MSEIAGRALYYETRQRVLVIGVPTIAVAAFLLIGARTPNSNGETPWALVVLAGLTVAIGVLNLVLTSGHKIDLDAAGLTIRRGPCGIWRAERITWEQVTGVEPTHDGVRIWTGSTWESAGLTNRPMLRRDDYVGTIRRWWRAHRSPPSPPG